jgi:Tol biopolymer transport system component
MRKRWWLAGILVLAAGLGFEIPQANAQYFGQNKVQYRQYKWSSIESDHFDVYYYPGLDSLAKRVLDLAEKTNSYLSAKMGHTLGHRVPIILFGSHNDFAQTNVTPELIDAGTGGFTELLRNRVVLPFTGSYEDLRHVVVHELTHAYMFDLIYGGNASALLARQSFFSVPLWFAEGLAEYMSLGMEPNAEMFLRDGTITNYLPPLYYAGGYIVYKEGQSAISYLVERHGEERLREILQKTRQMRSFDRAFERTVGMPIDKFDQQWRSWLKKRYWPTVATKEDPELFARRLTDHRRDQSNLNTSPAISPQGDRIAYFSDRRQYTDVYVMSAFDGKVMQRLIRGERNVQFEGIPSFRSALTWSPQGDRIGTTAKSGGRDVLYLVSAKNGKVLSRFDLHCDALAYPAWSPVSDSLVIVGVKDGRSDLYLVNTKNGKTTRLTNDTYDEKEPCWTPDGRVITFASDRLAPVVLHPQRFEKGYGPYGLFNLELDTGHVRMVLDTHGDDHSPAWSPDGRKLAFVSDRSGGPDIYLYDPADSTVTQLTEVQGGVSSLSWSRQNDRLVFSAFNRGGFDVFACKEPLSLDAVVDRLRRQAPQTVLSLDRARNEGQEAPPPTRPSLGALAGAWPDSVTTAPDTLTLAHAEAEPTLEASGHSDTVRVEPPDEPFGASTSYDPSRPWSLANDPHFGSQRDTIPVLPTRTPLVDNGGPFALPDSILDQPAQPYRVRMAPDYAGGGFYAASGVGFAGSTQFQFSDFLGNHQLFISTDIFSNSLEETNALAIYQYLPRRWDLGTGVFHFKNYFSSRVTPLGEQLGGPKLFSERTYGALATAAYPFDRFRRVDFNFTQMFVERAFFEEDPFGFVFESGHEYRSVTSPSISLVGDNALFGYYGPVNGQRYNLTYSPALGLFHNSLEYQTATYDARRYWDLTHGYTFAGRVLLGASVGRNPQTFRVGGFSTLRGYPDYDLLGTKLAITNIELRFPFIQQLGLVGPVPLGIFNLRGAVFLDAGSVWDDSHGVKLTHTVNGHVVTNDLRVGFGTGIRTALFFMIMKLDAAWNTDFDVVSRPRWHFSIGPEF